MLTDSAIFQTKEEQDFPSIELKDRGNNEISSIAHTLAGILYSYSLGYVLIGEPDPVIHVVIYDLEEGDSNDPEYQSELDELPTDYRNALELMFQRVRENKKKMLFELWFI